MKYKALQQRLMRLLNSGSANVLGLGLIGIERETLRVTSTGTISQNTHPQALGSPLTHPYITTDFSEALLEIITPPQQNLDLVLNFLQDAHKFVYTQLENEYLWPASMPGMLEGDQSIPIACYGKSNPGLMKTVYRRGIGLRYGRIMQTIAGIHYNYSLPEEFWPMFKDLEQNSDSISEFISASYMGMIRNLQRYGWLVPYLFGASPAVDKSFIANRSTNLKPFTKNTLYYPYATSLRMGDIGYQNSLEEGKGFRANYDSLDTYVRSLIWASQISCPEYERLGIIAANGEYQQLNTRVLQIENEHYSTIRPKQILQGLEKPVLALRNRGIRYVELRSLDVNIFTPLGINIDQMRFLNILLLFCLLNDSPRISAHETKLINANQLLVAHRGREPGLKLQKQDTSIRLRSWAQELLDAMNPIAEILDFFAPKSPDNKTIANNTALYLPYKNTINIAKEQILNPETTPSARMLRAMQITGESFAEFMQRLSRQYQTNFRKSDYSSPTGYQYFQDLALESHKRQQALETTNNVPFEQFLQKYFMQTE